MFVKDESQEQINARHSSDNYMPEFLRANAKAEKMARNAGYTKTSGIIQQLADDLCRSGDLTEEEAEILKKGKQERNRYIAHGKGNSTQSVPKESYNKFKDVLNKIIDFLKNGSITNF